MDNKLYLKDYGQKKSCLKNYLKSMSYKLVFSGIFKAPLFSFFLFFSFNPRIIKFLYFYNLIIKIISLVN